MIEPEVADLLLSFDDEDRRGEAHKSQRYFPSRVVRLAMAYARDVLILDVLKVFRDQKPPHADTPLLMERIKALSNKRTPGFTPRLGASGMEQGKSKGPSMDESVPVFSAFPTGPLADAFGMLEEERRSGRPDEPPGPFFDSIFVRGAMAWAREKGFEEAAAVARREFSGAGAEELARALDARRGTPPPADVSPRAEVQ